MKGKTVLIQWILRKGKQPHLRLRTHQISDHRYSKDMPQLKGIARLVSEILPPHMFLGVSENALCLTRSSSP
jgi:hypothetical protein